MRQRVKLAQALAHEPELLLLDEPLNGLDPAQRRTVVELIRRLGEEGRTVVVSSHVLHEVERMAPRVLVLVNGHLVASGSTSAIRELIADRPRSVRPGGGHRRPGPGAGARGGGPGGVGALRRRGDGRRGPGRGAPRPRAARAWRATWAPACRASSRWATTWRASTPTCTSARGGWAGDLGAHGEPAGLRADAAKPARREEGDRARPAGRPPGRRRRSSSRPPARSSRCSSGRAWCSAC